jgi:hypothetical protein
MKKNETLYSASKVISFAALLAMQTLPSTLLAQAVAGPKTNTVLTTKASSDFFLKGYLKEQASAMKLVAVVDGEPVLENSKKELMMIDPATGDIKPVSKSDYANMKPIERKNGKITFPPNHLVMKDRGSDKITFPPNCIVNNLNVNAYKIELAETLKVLGVDKNKHVVMENAAGEKVFIDPKTGDMVDYVGHVTLLK